MVARRITACITLLALTLAGGLGAHALTAQRHAAAASSAPGEPNARIKANPLYPVLLQYDREIAALRSTLDTRDFGHSSADIASATSAVRDELDSAATQIRALVAQKASAYEAREDAAIAALLASANAGAPSQRDVRARVAQTYRAQYERLRSSAAQDMATYQARLAAQQDAAYNAFVRSIQDRTQRAYVHRAAELREQELNLQLELARRDAPARLPVHLKLNAMWLDDATRTRLRARMAVIAAREDRIVGSRQRRDAVTLQAYRQSLQANGAADIARMSVDLQARSMANLSARRDVLAAQQAGPAQLPVTPAPQESRAGSDLRAEITALRAANRGRFRADAQASIAAYAQAGDDLGARFTAIGVANADATQATRAEMASLQRDRAALLASIVSDTRP